MTYDIQACPISETLQPSIPHHLRTSSPYRSPALASLLLEKVMDLKTRIVGFGLKPNALLGYVCPNTWLLKTAQYSISEAYTSYLEHLPASGMMRNGRIYKATNSVSSNGVSGHILLPTPVKADSKTSCGRGQYFGHLKPGIGYTLCPFIRDGPHDGIYPNPELTEALMTFPVSYTDLNVQEMPLYL